MLNLNKIAKLKYLTIDLLDELSRLRGRFEKNYKILCSLMDSELANEKGRRVGYYHIRQAHENLEKRRLIDQIISEKKVKRFVETA